MSDFGPDDPHGDGDEYAMGDGDEAEAARGTAGTGISYTERVNRKRGHWDALRQANRQSLLCSQANRPTHTAGVQELLKELVMRRVEAAAKLHSCCQLARVLGEDALVQVDTLCVRPAVYHHLCVCV